jgi:hypothetical protein
MQREERVLTEQIESLQKEKWVSRGQRETSSYLFHFLPLVPCFSLLNVSYVSSAVSGDGIRERQRYSACAQVKCEGCHLREGAPWTGTPDAAPVVFWSGSLGGGHHIHWVTSNEAPPLTRRPGPSTHDHVYLAKEEQESPG